jgi:hypothetical protein
MPSPSAEPGARPDPNPSARFSKKRWAREYFVLILGFIGLFVGFGFLIYEMPSGGRILSPTDQLVLAEIRNSTGERPLEGVVRGALQIAFDQSSLVRLVGDDRVAQLIKENPAKLGSVGDRMTTAAAREICRLEHAKGIVTGSLSSLGGKYMVNVQVNDCQLGDQLAREQAAAEDRDHLLDAVGTVANGLRAKLGESMNVIRKSERPVSEIGTASIPALQIYALGRMQAARGMNPAAIAMLRRATELDPSFGSAFFRLSEAYAATGNAVGQRESLETAYKLKDRVTENEWKRIESKYQGVTSGAKAETTK